MKLIEVFLEKGKSDMYILNNVGDMTSSWETSGLMFVFKFLVVVCGVLLTALR